jgi:hypothetical protein
MNEMPVEPEGWHMDADAPAWDAQAQAFSFFLIKQGSARVRCLVALDVMENAVQSKDLPEHMLCGIFNAHRQMIELRAAQKLNAGLLQPDGTVRLRADDI